jgi:uncharacterized protein YqjF (DUF2071 family)
VWFFSLDASSRLAVLTARAFWSLNYQFATMSLARHRERLRYSSRRRWPGPAGQSEIEAEIGPRLGGRFSDRDGSQAQPGTLEHFLIERYALYTQSARGRMYMGRVHHQPYPLHRARLLHCDETLLAAADLHAGAPPCHVLYCPGVDVEVFPLRGIEL